jgi:hypothetical protein
MEELESNKGNKSNLSEIPSVPQRKKCETHVEKKKYESPVKSPIRSPIPKTFHEGHEKDIPDPKDFMEHHKFDLMRETADKHLEGKDAEKTIREVPSTHENKGLWEKTKETISGGVKSIKNIISGNNNKS